MNLLSFCKTEIEKAIDIRQAKLQPVIPLRDALLCMNCEGVFPAGNKECPACGSEVSLSISVALSDEGTKEFYRRLAA